MNHPPQNPSVSSTESLHRYIVITPSLEQLLELVRRAIARRSTGFCFWSEPGFGKTHALRYLRDRISKIHPTLTILHSIMVTRSRVSDRLFFAALYRDFIDPTYALDLPGDVIRSKIIAALVAKCVEAADLRILILLDEVHRMDTREWSFFIDLTNGLNAVGLQCTVISCGQPEIRAVRQKLIEVERRDITRRYMRHAFEYEGIKDAETLKLILAQFDKRDGALIPTTDQEICVTEVFLGAQYRAGTRLASYAQPLWDAIKKSSDGLRNLHIGMEVLILIVETALEEMSIADPNFPAEPKEVEWWQSVLTSAGYREAMIF